MEMTIKQGEMTKMDDFEACQEGPGHAGIGMGYQTWVSCRNRPPIKPGMFLAHIRTLGLGE